MLFLQWSLFPFHECPYSHAILDEFSQTNRRPVEACSSEFHPPQKLVENQEVLVGLKHFNGLLSNLQEKWTFLNTFPEHSLFPLNHGEIFVHFFQHLEYYFTVYDILRVESECRHYLYFYLSSNTCLSSAKFSNNLQLLFKVHNVYPYANEIKSKVNIHTVCACPSNVDLSTPLLSLHVKSLNHAYFSHNSFSSALKEFEQFQSTDLDLFNSQINDLRDMIFQNFYALYLTRVGIQSLEHDLQPCTLTFLKELHGFVDHHFAPSYLAALNKSKNRYCVVLLRAYKKFLSLNDNDLIQQFFKSPFSKKLKNCSITTQSIWPDYLDFKEYKKEYERRNLNK
ncbi:hypothetical protein HMI56_001114 [Coelomomyces lativittatus]|nr:hypothetical protein HMI56_001114 [Coelomomyces lativittatus]